MYIFVIHSVSARFVYQIDRQSVGIRIMAMGVAVMAPVDNLFVKNWKNYEYKNYEFFSIFRRRTSRHRDLTA